MPWHGVQAVLEQVRGETGLQAGGGPGTKRLTPELRVGSGEKRKRQRLQAL